jgi:hypothetical protein
VICLFCEHVVAAYKAARSVRCIEVWHRLTASAFARYRRIGFAVFTSQRIIPVKTTVLGNRSDDFDVLRAVVRLIRVQVVNNIALTKRPSDLRLSYEAVLVYVAAHVRQSMSRHSEDNVPVRRNRSSAFPIRISLAHLCHLFRIAPCNPLLQGASHG